MNTRIITLAGLALVSAMFYGCGKKDGDTQPVPVVATTCPAGYVPATGAAVPYPNGQYQQYPGQYQQYPGQYQQYPGQYQQYPGNYQYANQQYPGAYNSAYPNCIPASQVPNNGTGTGNGTVLIPPVGGVLGTIPSGVSMAAYITVTNRDVFNRFLHENSGSCQRSALTVGRAECNNYTTGGYVEIVGNGSAAAGGVAAGPYKGIGTDGGYLPVSANFQYYTVNGGAGFELRAQGATYTQGYASILAIRGNTALTGQPIEVVLSYKSLQNSNFVEFARATLRPKQ